MYDPVKPYKHDVLKLIEETWHTPHVDVEKGIYPTITKKFSHPEVHHTDGIGTKGSFHWKKKTFENAVIDALAMNLNDLALVGAIPYGLQNHIIVPNDENNVITDIVSSLAKECKERDIAMTGGETSIHNNFDGLDISITVAGFVKKPRVNQLRAGDVLIGIKSSGLHSNGFTKVREVFGDEYREEFVTPTWIYLDDILNLIEKYDIHGMMHITGGAFSKLKDIMNNVDVKIHKDHTLQPHPVFLEMYEKGVSDKEMYTTFNCGIGFIISVSKEDKDAILAERVNCSVIGEVIEGNGKIQIESTFSDTLVDL